MVAATVLSPTASSLVESSWQQPVFVAQTAAPAVPVQMRWDEDRASLVTTTGHSTSALFNEVGPRVAVVELLDGRAVVPEMTKILARPGLAQRVIATSTDILALFELESKVPGARTLWLHEEGVGEPGLEELVSQMRSHGVDGVAFHHLNVHPLLVDRMRQEQFLIAAWGVPAGNEVDRLTNLGVNFLMLDESNMPKDLAPVSRIPGSLTAP